MTDQFKNVRVMDIDFTSTTMDLFLSNAVYPRLAQSQKCFIVTANPEIVIATRHNARFKETVQSADYVLPDGIGIINAAKMMGTPIDARLCGVDVMHHMLGHAAEKGYSVYFIGAKEDSNRKAVENALKKYPGLIVAGRQHGYADLYDEAFIRTVVEAKPDIVLVALGMMKQEGWIRDHINRFDKGVFMGVGGSLDALSGMSKRAPSIWIRFQLEWLYRLIRQPKRIIRVVKVGQFMLMHIPIIRHLGKIIGYNRSRARKKR
ncbi:WecB/TagA/CpsF family glycosyltransferase [Salinicoccus cyprini]|uniref:WecB/TagA/CpsF family glycosyltransferase n=1 Tax=Salinicoccus cyprini TaxID=2493691 RepID=A0A558AXA5_9STAP|nr:WecB/TagA/CpsF family glycosyltransferase [Salinicoccus cyprini]TVT28895.1 WecB/TagA/CpsF family glycosyltransferase [Salinicoccus cyprini]